MTNIIKDLEIIIDLTDPIVKALYEFEAKLLHAHPEFMGTWKKHHINEAREAYENGRGQLKFAQHLLYDLKESLVKELTLGEKNDVTNL